MSDVTDLIAGVFPDLRRTYYFCPGKGEMIPGCGSTLQCCPEWACQGYERRSVIDQVIHLNDFHQWTREQIADWLESLDVDLSFGKVD